MASVQGTTELNSVHSGIPGYLTSCTVCICPINGIQVLKGLYYSCPFCDVSRV